jgi:hypothetical protein
MTILVAALGVGWAAVDRLLDPMPLDAVGVDSALQWAHPSSTWPSAACSCAPGDVGGRSPFRSASMRCARAARADSFLSVHVLVPGAWTVQRGHDLLEQLEAEWRAAVPQLVVFTHLEPLGDPSSFADTVLDRSTGT